MMVVSKRIVVLSVLSCVAGFISIATQLQAAPQAINPAKIERKLTDLAPIALGYNEAQLTAGEKALLTKMVEAGRLIDRIYLEQLDPSYAKTFDQLKTQYEKRPTDANRTLLEYFWINKGPYDQIGSDGYTPFLKRTEKFQPGRNFYPAGLTVEAFDKWVASLSPEEAAAARSDFTVIGRDGNGSLHSIPYSAAYGEWLRPLAGVLESAAIDVDRTPLAEFLRARAQAFRTNDYEASEALWVDLNRQSAKHPSSHIDITVGPYENYSDELMKRKAAFQFYVGVLQPEKTKALQVYGKYVRAMDEHLWRLMQRYYREGREVAPGKRFDASRRIQRWTPPGEKTTLVAVDLVYSGGKGNEGKQTIAYNLPNISEWRDKYGTKKVMMINIIEGKFNLILKPIADIIMDKEFLSYIDGPMFSDNTVRHEVAHGIGPSTIRIAEAAKVTVTTSRERLQQYYSTFEEAKAEIVSLLFGYYLLDNKLLSKDPKFNDDFAKRMATDYVASTFRTVRFGVTSDHAKGKLFEFNRLTQLGAIESKDGKYRVRFDKFQQAVEKLAMEICDLEMHGDVAMAAALLADHGKPTVEMQQALARIDGDKGARIPVDLRVQYLFGDNYGVINKKK